MTTPMTASLSERATLLIVFLAGAVLPLAFAPFEFYPLAVLSPAVLFYFWLDVTVKEATWRGFVFGLGLFGVGVSWVYVAIHDFGHSAMPVAALLTLLFVALLALIPALVGYLSARLRPVGLSQRLQILLWLPLLWTLGEWMRGWLFSGFPWLNLGYSMIDAPLRGYAPLLGVYGVAFMVVLTAGALVWTRQHRDGWKVALPMVAVLWGAGALLDRIEWSEALGEPINVTLIQGNVAQSTKWDPAHIVYRLDTYADLTREHFNDSDLIIWPENAITVFHHSIKEEYFNPLEEEAKASDTDLILGVPELDENGVSYYTTLMSLGSENKFYRKRHLVPFGEFLPLEGLFRGLINFFDMPMSSFSPGSDEQALLQAAGHKIAATVCYEDAFGEEMIGFLPEATLLVNGSNNAWYGDSFAPHQHLQISRMRALEMARPMLRATTNGISALINHEGRIEKRSPQFEQAIVKGEVQGRGGATPYVIVGNWLVIGGLISGLLVLARVRRRQGA